MENSSNKQNKLLRLGKIIDAVEGKPTELVDDITSIEEKADSAISTADKALRVAEETQKQEGPAGYTPVKGVDYTDGKDGIDYILTEADKKDIANNIHVPVVEKTIEKTVETIIKEQPIVTEVVKEVALHDTGAEIVKKINDLPLEEDYLIEMQHIKGLMKALEERYKATWPAGGGSSGIKEIVAGTGVTVDNSNLGYPKVSASGGVGAWSTPIETPVANGSVLAYTVGVTPPTDVIADGTTYFSGFGYTHSVVTGKITFDIGGGGPTQFVRFR